MATVMFDNEIMDADAAKQFEEMITSTERVIMLTENGMYVQSPGNYEGAISFMAFHLKCNASLQMMIKDAIVMVEKMDEAKKQKSQKQQNPEEE